MFHLSVKPISRSAGRSATAAAAYRSGSLVVDERTGDVHDYTRKGGVVASEIVLPAGSPAWATDRTALWNAAEAAEKRKDARMAREYEVAIPKELDRHQALELVRDFAAELVERYGVAVDFAVHRDHRKTWDGSEKGFEAFHGHVLTTTRKLGRDGFGEKASPELSDSKRKTLGRGDGASEVEAVRKVWEVANRHLERAGQTQRIDRRSLEDQGIDREPTQHLGPIVTALERRGVLTDKGDINRQIEVQGRAVVPAHRPVRQVEPARAYERAAPAVDVASSAARNAEASATSLLRLAVQQEELFLLEMKNAHADLVAQRNARLKRVQAWAAVRIERREQASSPHRITQWATKRMQETKPKDIKMLGEILQSKAQKAPSLETLAQKLDRKAPHPTKRSLDAGVLAPREQDRGIGSR